MTTFSRPSKRKRAQSLAGAATTFYEGGYQSASMSAIAFCAGVSKGTLYNHFSSKADRFKTFVEDECERTIASHFANFEERPSDEKTPEDLAMVVVAISRSRSAVELHNLVTSVAIEFPDLCRLYYQKGQARGIGLMASWLRSEVQKSQLDLADVEFAAEQFWCLCQARSGSASQGGPNGSSTTLPQEKVAKAAMRLIQLGYAQQDH